MDKNIFDIIYESFSIYRSIVICKNDSQVQDICEVLKNKDHAVTTSFQDVSSMTRIIVVSKDDFDCDHGKYDIQWNDFNVLFADTEFRDRMGDFTVLIERIQIVAFFDHKVSRTL